MLSIQKFNRGARGAPSSRMVNCLMASRNQILSRSMKIDEDRMREVFQFTAITLETSHPVPFGALIVDTRTGKRLMMATNAVMSENDPSSHAETRTVRLACKKLKKTSLAGYTMYSTCEPCPMCMANALWARLDRVVFGATIGDASQHVMQIYIPAKEVAKRSDMDCVVEGPVLRELCNTLFTHPNMQKAFRNWSSSREKHDAWLSETVK
jgi:tRNA(Arg) A34 adenosine deaminase TadA